MRGIRSCLVLAALAVLAFWWAPNAIAGCTGASPTWTATNDNASVQTCVNNASNGDTINVQAGTANWSSAVTVSKNVSIIGAGQGVTIVNGVPFNINGVSASGTAASVRISGFTFNFGGNEMTISDSVHFRMDHDDFNNAPPAATCVLSYSDTGTPTEGVFDHITSSYCQFEELGGVYGNSNNSDNLVWSTSNPVGTSHAIYFEDSTFVNADPSSSGYFNCWDEYQGGRYVIRFSTLNGCRVEAHGIQADNSRGGRSWEIYNNTIENSNGVKGYWPFSQRSGTGMIFHNTLDVNWINLFGRMDGPRLNEDSIASQVPNWQFCDGTSKSGYLATPGALNSSTIFSSSKSLIIDTQGTGGYRCRDQIGTSGDLSTWPAGWATTPPPQGSAPVYIWENSMGGSEMPMNVTCETPGDNLCTNETTNLIVQNRDYYLYNASFAGTNGIGEGTLASRPSTCTAGVGYWATDQGNWNAKSIPSGQLYVCTSANTWGLYYAPYPYPHPLQGNSSAVQVSPPTGLQASVQ